MDLVVLSLMRILNYLCAAVTHSTCHPQHHFHLCSCTGPVSYTTTWQASHRTGLLVTTFSFLLFQKGKLTKTCKISNWVAQIPLSLY